MNIGDCTVEFGCGGDWKNGELGRRRLQIEVVRGETRRK